MLITYSKDLNLVHQLRQLVPQCFIFKNSFSQNYVQVAQLLLQLEVLSFQLSHYTGYLLYFELVVLIYGLQVVHVDQDSLHLSGLALALVFFLSQHHFKVRDSLSVWLHFEPHSFFNLVSHGVGVLEADETMLQVHVSINANLVLSGLLVNDPLHGLCFLLVFPDQPCILVQSTLVCRVSYCEVLLQCLILFFKGKTLSLQFDDFIVKFLVHFHWSLVFFIHSIKDLLILVLNLSSDFFKCLSHIIVLMRRSLFFDVSRRELYLI